MNTIDTRDLNERLTELNGLRQALADAKDALDAADENTAADERDELEAALDEARTLYAEEEQDERAELEALRDAVGDEWRDGVTLIPDDDFEEHARQLAEDGAMCDCSQWPLTCIDWAKAAEELQMDYTSVEYNGTMYWFR